MKPKIAVVGGNGFIGKNLVSYFLERYYDVTVIDRSAKSIQNKEGLKNFATNIRSTSEILDVTKDADYIVWLVHASVPSTKDDSLVDDFLLNISPIVKFLEKADTLQKLKKFIYLSSGGTIYGNVSGEVSVPENHLQRPISGYGLSKSVAEKYIEFLGAGKNYETVILRPSNVYGPYQNLVKPQGIIGFAFKSIRDKTSLDLYDGGKVVRDFIFVDDVAAAVEKTLSAEQSAGKVSAYNIGSNEGHSIKEILDRIEKISGSQLQIVHKSSRNFDCAYNVLDSSAMQKDYGWQKSVPLDEGLKKVWDWIVNEG